MTKDKQIKMLRAALRAEMEVPSGNSAKAIDASRKAVVMIHDAYRETASPAVKTKVIKLAQKRWPDAGIKTYADALEMCGTSILCEVEQTMIGPNHAA